MSDVPFQDTTRIDAHDKVCGKALFGADDARPEIVHAALAVATIGKGRIVSLDTCAAAAVSGVRLVLTHEDLGDVKSAGFLMAGGYGFQSLQPMLSPAVAYRGQPIALVAADSLEAAIEAAALVESTYTAEPISVTLDAPGAETINQADTPLKNFIPKVIAGDADKSFDGAPVKIDARFTCPPQHQNPIELIATVAEWHNGNLTVHEGTQNAEAIRHGLMTALGLTADQVRVISPYAGGGFGQKNSLQMQTVLAAVAARRLQRPLKLVVSRAQIFHDASFRPASRQRVRLGAARSGQMLAAIHEVDAQTSRHDFMPAEFAAVSSRLYGIENFRGHERLVRTDVQTPGYMRAPFEHGACFAMESCVDERSRGAAARQRHEIRSDRQAAPLFSSFVRMPAARGRTLRMEQAGHGAAVHARRRRNLDRLGRCRRRLSRPHCAHRGGSQGYGRRRRAPQHRRPRDGSGYSHSARRRSGAQACRSTGERGGAGRRHAGRAAARDCGLLGYGLSRSHSERCRRSDAPGTRPARARTIVQSNIGSNSQIRRTPVAGSRGPQEGTRAARRDL
jgi:CO/xanthine dehydrogenase Mo-binding subunit